jgi:hypothetical protein
MECMYELHCQLHALVGDEAMALMAAHLDQAEQGAANGAPSAREPAMTHPPET